ncbi:MAG: methyltransferase domain-containing protein [Elusimicrobiota bacterium]
MNKSHRYKKSILKNGYRVIDCLDCGFWHVYPVPSEKELESFYRNKYYSVLKAGNNRSMTDRKHDPDGYYTMQYKDRMRQISDNLSDSMPRSVIDLGAGYGDFLHFMKISGWKVSGVEPSSASFDEEQSRTLGIIRGSIDSAYRKLKPVSVVTVNNVLEHVREPFKTLEIIRRRLLLPGGLLFIVIPNDFNILQNALMKTEIAQRPNNHNYWLDPLEHLNYWSCATIKRFLNKNGFRIIDLYSDFPMEIFRLMGDDFLNDAKKGRSVHLKRVSFEKNLYASGLVRFKDTLYRSFARNGIGRNLQIIAKVHSKRKL